MSLGERFLARTQWREAYALDNWQPANGATVWIPGLMVQVPSNPRWFIGSLAGVISVSLCQSIKIKPTKMYVCMYVCTYVRTYACIYTCMHVCIACMFARTLSKLNQQICISPAPGRSSKLTHTVVQCSHGHVIGIVSIDAISVEWRVRAGQLATGGVAPVSRSWVKSPPSPRWFIECICVSLCQRIKIKPTNMYVCMYVCTY